MVITPGPQNRRQQRGLHQLDHRPPDRLHGGRVVGRPAQQEPVVHFLPGRSWLSDSFTGAVGVSALSWFAASLEVVAATTLGAVGFGVLQARGGLVSATQPNPLSAA